MLEDDFRPEMLSEKDLVVDPLHPHYRHLPLDTRHFPDLELDILALFEDLDAALGGWCIWPKGIKVTGLTGLST